MSRTVAFATLGCKVNQYDTEAMMRLFRLSGYTVVPFEEPADVYVVDTCTVTGRAAARSRQVIRQAARRQSEAVVVVSGCYPQTAPGAVLAMPEVSVVLGNRDRDRVVELVEEALDAKALGRFTGPLNAVAPIARLESFEETPIDQFSGRTRAPLKVQDGCDMFCTYCIIPYARGPARSRRPDQVVSEAQRLVQAGFKEVVLTGIHLGSYGKDLEGITLTGLLRRLHDIDGLERIRLSSLEPMHVTPELIDALAEWPKLCPHLHLSLQSGSDPVLRRMKRSYTAGEYRRVVEALRRRVPDLGLSTDVMVGFPGETEELFEGTYRFVEEIAFSRLHVFPYSARKGTAAATFPGQIPSSVKQERAHRLGELGQRLAESFAHRFVGRTVEVLVEEEGPVPGIQEGYTPEYVRVVFPGPDSLKGEIVKVRIRSAAAGVSQGELVAGTVEAAVPHAGGGMAHQKSDRPLQRIG